MSYLQIYCEEISDLLMSNNNQNNYLNDNINNNSDNSNSNINNTNSSISSRNNNTDSNSNNNNDSMNLNNTSITNNTNITNNINIDNININKLSIREKNGNIFVEGLSRYEIKNLNNLNEILIKGKNVHLIIFY